LRSLRASTASFCAGRELTRVATPETEAQWLEAANDKNVRQVENMVSGHTRGDRPTDPADPTLRKRVLRYEVSEETVALTRQAKQILEREYGERLDDDALQRIYARMVIDGAVSGERTHAPYQVAVTICEQCKRGWQAGGGIVVEMSLPTLETALCDAQHIGSVGEANAAIAEPSGDATAATKTIGPQRAKSDIPPALRRKSSV
jgi:hypothetical protein